MILEPKEVTLFDADGSPHSYVITAHPFAEGMPIVQALAAVVIPPLVASLPPGARLEDLAGAINPTSLAGGIGQALAAAPPDLVARVLSRTVRDGVRLTGKALDCYAGNYGEALRAAWEVAQFNGFFKVAGMSRAAQQPRKAAE